MAATSSEVKNRYNKKAYRQWNTLIKPDLFDRLEDYREKHGISRSAFLETAIDALERQSE